LVYVVTNPERVGETTDLSEAARVEWAPQLGVGVVVLVGAADHALSLV
jgi:hypothetical protein